MEAKDIKTINRIIANMVVENINNGSTMEEAKTQAYNRMNTEYPEIMTAWLIASGM